MYLFIFLLFALCVPLKGQKYAIMAAFTDATFNISK